jgi:AAA domain, putative AbiEii toxin, Type IV TA system
MLTELGIETFKSFSAVRIPMGPLTLMLGENGVGKSNALEALRLLHDLARGCTLEAALVGPAAPGLPRGHGVRGDAPRSGTASFAISSTWDLGTLGQAVHRARIDLGMPRATLSETLEPAATTLLAAPRTDRSSLGAPPNATWRALQRRLRDAVFLDPDLDAMRSYSNQGDATMASGAGASAVALDLCSVHERKLELIDWLDAFLPNGVRDLSFERTALGDVMLVIVERDGARTPARYLSDGTLRFIGLATTLLAAGPDTLVVVDELERSIHPSRCSVLADLLQQATARGLQILGTTRSPDLLEALASIRPQALHDAVLLAGAASKGGTVVTRLGQLPDFRSTQARRGMHYLMATGWLERAL